MTTICPECGAILHDGMSCWEQLGVLLAWEATDPALAAQHFVTVASYNLQHPAMFVPAALAELRTQFVAHLREGRPVSQIRAATGRVTQGSTRVLRPLAERRAILRHWPLTIVDVAGPHPPDGAATRVLAWAQAIAVEITRETRS